MEDTNEKSAIHFASVHFSFERSQNKPQAMIKKVGYLPLLYIMDSNYLPRLSFFGAAPYIHGTSSLLLISGQRPAIKVSGGFNHAVQEEGTKPGKKGQERGAASGQQH
jgi:hypothetical protein